MSSPLTLSVNGNRHELEVDPDRPLLEILRNQISLTGTKYGCGEGQCGSCTVLLDGNPVRSCVTPVSAATAKEVRTIEGVAGGETLHPVQQAFLDCGALQCGYCTPGMIVAAVALLERNARPSPGTITEALQGHLCRCGCYPQIVAAVMQAAGLVEEDRR